MIWRRIGLAVVLLVIGGLLLLRLYGVEAWLFRQIAFHGTARPLAQLAGKDELSVLICGSGSPLPDKTRAGACALIAAGDRYYLVDAGLDSARNLLLWRVPLDRIAGILVTHLHSDHIAELGEIRLQTWVAGRKTPLPVYGPPGIEAVVEGFNQAYAADATYRTAHHGPELLPPEAVPLTARPIDLNGQAIGPVLDEGGLTIRAVSVRHDPVRPAYGYRFDFAGHAIMVSGDTAPSDNLIQGAKAADILVHEALSPEMVGILHDALSAAGSQRAAKIMQDIPSYHTSPEDAARIANQAGVRLLVLTHLVPMLPNAMAQRLFLRGVAEIRTGDTVLAHDGLLVRLGRDEAMRTETLE